MKEIFVLMVLIASAKPNVYGFESGEGGIHYAYHTAYEWAKVPKLEFKDEKQCESYGKRYFAGHEPWTVDLNGPTHQADIAGYKCVVEHRW